MSFSTHRPQEVGADGRQDLTRRSLPHRAHQNQRRSGAVDNGSPHLQVKHPVITDDGCGDGCLAQSALESSGRTTPNRSDGQRVGVQGLRSHRQLACTDMRPFPKRIQQLSLCWAVRSVPGLLLLCQEPASRFGGTSLWRSFLSGLDWFCW